MYFNTSDMRFQWCLGSLVKTENRKKNTVMKIILMDREQKRKRLQEEKKRKEVSINCHLGQENDVQGDKFYPLNYEKYVPEGKKKVQCSRSEKEIYVSPYI